MPNVTGTTLRGVAIALVLAAGVSAAPSADAMSKKDKRALVGAVVGGLAGALVSNGDPWATAGGALAGGAIGNVTTPDRNHHGRGNDWDRRQWERKERERREREHRERERANHWRNR